MQDFSNVNELIQRADKKTELPGNFFDLLSKDDDWSIVIKCHALLETVIRIWVNDRFHELSGVGFEDYLLNLSLNSRAGILVLAKKLSIVCDFDVEFIKLLSSVRNRYAHKIGNIGIGLDKMLNDNEKRDLALFHKQCYVTASETGISEQVIHVTQNIYIRVALSAWINYKPASEDVK